MPQENLIWSAIIFVSILFTLLGGVIISFLFLYQKKKFRHQQEVTQMQETFAHEMLHSKAEIQEQTLQYVAAEIHDNFNPTLSVINLNLAGVIPTVAEPVKETITDTKAMVKQLMGEMRTMSKNLNTNEINRIGFVAMLEKYVVYLRKSGAYAVEFDVKGPNYRLPSDKEIILFRMCQEVLNNIVKHAEAKTIDITIDTTNQAYQVQIKDDGNGFDPSFAERSPEKQEGSGLRNLHNRAAIIAAGLEIQSYPGSGTTIIINLK